MDCPLDVMSVSEKIPRLVVSPPIVLLRTRSITIYHLIHSDAIESGVADAVLEKLSDTYFYVTVIQSCPAACDFSRISGSVVYLPSPGKVSALDLFSVSKNILKGDGVQQPKVRAATTRLMHLLAAEAAVFPGLVTSIQEAPTERLQFLLLADAVLRKLTPSFQVSRRSHAYTSLEDVDSSISSKYLGDGLTTHLAGQSGRESCFRFCVYRPRKSFRGQHQ